MFISAMSGGLPASMAATNFCSRSPKVAQSISTSTFLSLAHASICLDTTSLPAVTKLLNSQTRSLVLAWAGAMPRSACRPAAVPPVMTAAFFRNSRRAMRPASSWSARFLRRLSMEAPPLEREGAPERGWDVRMLPQGGAAGKQTVGRPRDGRRVDAVVAIEVAAGSRLAEVVHPERQLRHPEGAAQEAQRVRVAVEHRHHRDALLLRGHQVEYVGTRGPQAPVEQVGAGHREHAGAHALGGQGAAGRHRLRHHDAGREDVHRARLRVVAGLRPRIDQAAVSYTHLRA